MSLRCLQLLCHARRVAKRSAACREGTDPTHRQQAEMFSKSQQDYCGVKKWTRYNLGVQEIDLFLFEKERPTPVKKMLL